QGILLQSPRGVIVAGIDPSWWESQIHNLANNADPTHLALYLTDDAFEYCLPRHSYRCVYFGAHCASRSRGSNGNAPVQTYAWATYGSPGFYATRQPGPGWVEQDINAPSHEISEWADDPFVTNTVEKWPFSPGFTGSACSDLLETGDPVTFSG